MLKIFGLALIALLPVTSVCADTYGTVAGFVQARINNGRAEAEVGIGASAQVNAYLDVRMIGTTIFDGRDDKPRLNIALADIHSQGGSYGIRLGRVQHQLGFYTESLNWAPARDMHLAPQGIYRENFRYLLRSGDGVQPYVSWRMGDAKIFAEITYSKSPTIYPLSDVSAAYIPGGRIDEQSARTTGYSLSIKHGPTMLRYDQQRLHFNETVQGLSLDVSTAAHYIGLRHDLSNTTDVTAEYLYIDKRGRGFQNNSPAEGVGLNVSWQMTEDLKLTGGVSGFWYDRSNRRPNKLAYSEDVFVALRYRRSRWISTLEAHHIRGVAALSVAEMAASDGREVKLIGTIMWMF